MLRLLAILAGLLTAGAACADEVRVAVAANFAAPMQTLAVQFEKDSGHKVLMSSGSTGKFYAQIRNGAPFDILLAADEDVPAKLEQEGRTVAGSRYTYATGRLVLWSARPGLVDASGDVLASAAYAHLAIANPKVAPYGRAAMQVLAARGLEAGLAARVVQAENIAQAYQFAASGNAQLAFVAMSQVYVDGRLMSGSAWVVPPTLHAPIRQQAVLLGSGAVRPAAAALLRYLKTEPARAIIRRYGYEN